jgi:hypothetical protein
MAILCLAGVAAGPEGAPGPHRGGRHARRPPVTRAELGARRDGRAAEGRAGAQPGADAGAHARAAARRAVRQHRARLQLGHGHAHGAASWPTGSPKPASAPTWAPRSSSTSSAAPPACGRAARCWWPPCARSSCTAACRARRWRARTWPRCNAAWPTWRATCTTCARYWPALRGGGQPLHGRHRGRADPAARAGAALGVPLRRARHWAEGGAGALELARAVVALCDGRTPAAPRFVYDADAPACGTSCGPWPRACTALPTSAPAPGARTSSACRRAATGHLAVCVAKTQYSFSADPALLRRARWPHAARARSAAVRRRRLRRHGLRRHPDHARPARPAGGRGDRSGRGWAGRGAVLKEAGRSSIGMLDAPGKPSRSLKPSH